MPAAPLRYCAEPHCPEKVPSGRCPAHQQANRQHQRRFAQDQTNYNTPRWLRLRDAFRTAHPFCINVDTDPRCTLLTDVVDHIEPHRGDETLFFDEANLAPMCLSCHNRKTASEVWQGY